MGQLALSVLKSKYFIWLAATMLYFARIDDKIIYPNIENYAYEHYTDEANQGNSQVLQSLVTDSLIKLDFKLNKGFSNPYVGLSISSILEKYINAIGYNRINLLIKGHNIDRIGLTIFNPPHVSPLEQDEIPFHTFLNISNIKKIYELPLSKFEAPEWWKDMYHIPENERLRPDLSKILRINLGSAYTVDTDRLLSLEIYKLSFSRDNHSLFLGLIVGEIIFITFIFCIGYLVVYIRGRKENITVLYKPLEAAQIN